MPRQTFVPITQRRVPWTDQEKEQIKEAARVKMSAEAVSSRLGRSVVSVITMASRLGVDIERKDDRDRKRLDRFMLARWQDNSIQALFPHAKSDLSLL